jgi:hypothetical protein
MLSWCINFILECETHLMPGTHVEKRARGEVHDMLMHSCIVLCVTKSSQCDHCMFLHDIVQLSRFQSHGNSHDPHLAEAIFLARFTWSESHSGTPPPPQLGHKLQWDFNICANKGAPKACTFKEEVIPQVEWHTNYDNRTKVGKSWI